MVAVIDNRHGFCMRIQAFKLRKALYYNANGNIPTSDNGNDFIEIGNPCARSKIVHKDTNRDIKPSCFVLVRLAA